MTSNPLTLPLIALAFLFGLPGFIVSATGQTGNDGLEAHPKVAPALREIRTAIKAGPFKANWASLEAYEIPQWYKDAKFGIFVHWGVYSVPAFGSEWYPRQMYIDKERRGDNFYRHHLQTYGPQKTFGYKDFIPSFKAEQFDAESWAKLFRESGARYVIPVAEHHDGFPMYDCAFTRWDAVEMGPKRDIIAELAQAVRGEGLKFGVSSHRAFNWMFYVRNEDFDNVEPEFFGLYGRPHPRLFHPDAAKYQDHFVPQDQQFMDDWLARCGELVDRYQPDIVWFDFGITPGLQEATYATNPFGDHLKQFAAYYYNQTQDRPSGIGIINYKWGAFPEKAAVLDKERSKMAEIRKPFWQTDTAISSSSWGYTEDQRYKSTDRLVDDLVDIVSKNGCLLLNVGPRADGTIPEKDQKILRDIGQWLSINGEAIYETTYWKTFGEGPTAVATGHISEAKNKPFVAEDIRFTARGDVLYATGLKWPDGNKITIKTLAAGNDLYPKEIAAVSLLGSDHTLQWKRSPKGLVVQLPEKAPCDYAYVLKIVPKSAR